ncbi:MAG TPA: ubiquitin activation protein, partial [Candidatus Paceibacterota bacterium]|nr:ubiquitin activation protein [Candidatus Paceibacterota bacterium]
MTTNIGASLAGLSQQSALAKPELLNLSQGEDVRRLEKLVADGAVRRVCDDFEEQHRELFAVRNPSRVYAPDFEKEFQAHYAALKAGAPLHEQGVWAYFPWSSTLSHLLPEGEYRAVRTARNRNLVTEEEQKKFYDMTVGIGGLSVGSSVAFAIALSGGGK